MIALWTSRSNEAPHYRLEPPQPLARFASMISAKLRRGHDLSAEHHFGALASRVDRVACSKKTKCALVAADDDDDG